MSRRRTKNNSLRIKVRKNLRIEIYHLVQNRWKQGRTNVRFRYIYDETKQSLGTDYKRRLTHSSTNIRCTASSKSGWLFRRSDFRSATGNTSSRSSPYFAPLPRIKGTSRTRTVRGRSRRQSVEPEAFWRCKSFMFSVRKDTLWVSQWQAPRSWFQGQGLGSKTRFKIIAL